MKKRCIVHIGMHKTGSSSIQATLSRQKSSSDFHYVKLDSPNHGGNIFSLFTEYPEKYHAWRKQGLSKEDVHKINQKTERMLISNFTETNSDTVIISGEDIVNLSQDALEKLKTFLNGYFETTLIVGYVRSPKSYIESAFQQSLKGLLSTFNIKGMYPIYQSKFKKFDLVFTQENVKLRYFNPKNFVGNDVVLDFCNFIGIEIDSSTTERTNDSLSKEAISLLYTYRKFGPGYGVGDGVMRENNTMINQLSTIGVTKFKFSDTVVKPVLEEYRNDISWIENRLGISFETINTKEENEVTSEKDLLTVDESSVKALKNIIGTSYLPVGLEGDSSIDIALLVQVLRLKMADLYNIRLAKQAQKDQVLIGKDNYLFLTGGNHKVLKFFTGEIAPHKQSRLNFWENIDNRKRYCREKGIEYRHFIFPDKLSALKHKTDLDILPLFNNCYVNDENNSAEQVHYFKFSNNDAERFFPKTDTHLNVYGTLKLLEQIIENDEDIRRYYSYVQSNLKLESNFIGDLGIKLNPKRSETRVVLKTSGEIKHYHNGVTSGNIGIIDILINENALYNKKLLIFGDSFFRAMLKHLAYFYKEVVFCRTPFLHPEVVTAFSPDIIFTGNAERYLSNVKSDKELEDFFKIPLTKGLSLSPTPDFHTVFHNIFGFGYERK